MTKCFLAFLRLDPVADNVSRYTTFFDEVFMGKTTFWLNAPLEQPTVPAPESTLGLAESVHDLAFDTAAEIVDWPTLGVTVEGDA